MVEFEIANLDIVSIPSSEIEHYLQHPQWKNSIVEQPGLNTYYLGLNCQKTPLTDTKVRQAICFAIDREKIRATVFECRGLLAASPIPPLLPLNSIHCPTDSLRPDPPLPSHGKSLTM